MLMMHHAGRYVDGVALIPIVSLTPDLGIAVAFERIELGLGMCMAVAFRMRQIDKNRTDRHTSSLKTILLSAPPHQEIGSAMFRLVRFFMLVLVHRNPAAIFRPVLRFLFGESRKNLRIVCTAFFELLHLAHIHVGFQMPGKSRQIAYRCLAAVEQLMGRSIGNVKDRSGKEVVAL